jgi:general nucleoside transport system permease protein
MSDKVKNKKAATPASEPLVTPANVSAVTPAGVAAAAEPSRFSTLTRDLFTGNALIPVLAVLASFLVGGILIALSSESVQSASSYFFARPGDTLLAIWNSIFGAYDALFRGSVYNYQADTFGDAMLSLTQTLAYATPITIAGLGLAVAFRSGLFNIGGTGQIIAGAVGSTVVALYLPIWPGPLHFLVAVLAGVVAGALFGGFVGFLKATTGANEVIVTIMFNYVAVFLLHYSLTTWLKAPLANNPQSSPLPQDVLYPSLAGPQYPLHAGFVAMLLAVAGVWWLMNRSSVGFHFKALGHNPSASRVAGINIGRTYFLVMAVSGALAGLAGTSQILGTEKYLGTGVAATFGFDAITVALLGRSNPLGVLAAGILFGGLRAGAVTMQANQNVPIDIVYVVQSMIVLFIAAPPLVRSIFFMPKPKEARA